MNLEEIRTQLRSQIDEMRTYINSPACEQWKMEYISIKLQELKEKTVYET